MRLSLKRPETAAAGVARRPAGEPDRGRVFRAFLRVLERLAPRPPRVSARVSDEMAHGES